jgi:hypothetical protein
MQQAWVPEGNQEDVHHHDAPQHPPLPLMERLPLGSKGKHCNTAQAPKDVLKNCAVAQQ